MNRSLLPEGGGAIMAMRGGGGEMLPAGYTETGYKDSVLPAGAGAIAPMRGGAGSKELTVLGRAFTVENPNDLVAEGDLTASQKAVLAHLNVSAGMSFEDKKAILIAIYDNNCLRDPQLGLDGACEPLRALVSALSMALLGKVLDRGVALPAAKPAVVDDMVQITIRVPIGRLNLVAGVGAVIKPAAATASGSESEQKEDAAAAPAAAAPAPAAAPAAAAPAVASPINSNAEAATTAKRRMGYGTFGSSGGTRKLRRAKQ